MGKVIEIERWSTSDGPGTRTVVFLKGCPLKCPWCANPESQNLMPQIGIFAARCVGCGACQRECPQKVAIPAKEGAFTDDGTCLYCGRCTQFCHSNARTWLGQEMSADEVMQTIKKDMVFYRKSGGGITFSGGEPFIQVEFLAELVQKCRKLGIHTTVETCGCFAWEKCQEVIKLIDLVIYDIKHMDDAEHEKLTGASNQINLQNAQHISDMGQTMLVRIPIIPTLNDSPENVQATAKFALEHLPSALGIELLPYHRLGESKYAALGIPYSLKHIQTPSDEHMDELSQMVRDCGVKVISKNTDYAGNDFLTAERMGLQAKVFQGKF